VRLLLVAAMSLSAFTQAQVIDDAVAPALDNFQPLRLHSSGEQLEPHTYWWVRSRIRRVERDFLPDDAERVQVLNSRWQIVEMDRNHDEGDIFAATVALWEERDGYEEVFRCQGNACGTSQHWVEAVFGQSILHGLNRHQNFSTGLVGDDIRVLYTVRRGTQINYLYWLEAIRTQPADQLAQQLRRGVVVLADAYTPQVWSDLLDRYPHWQLILVGHDYTPQADAALNRGREAASEVAQVWRQAGIEAARLRVESVGYFAPDALRTNRVTVLLPPSVDRNP
jgi:hypothetical protein